MSSGSSAASGPSSSVNFPLSDSPQRQGQGQGPPVKVPHLPFRRISLPTVPSLLHRVSVVSVASFDPSNLPQVQPISGRNGNGSPQQNPRSQVRQSNPGTKATQSRPVSVVSPRKRNPRRDSSVKPVDDRLAAKCRKVVDEFYETEKAYVDGLELIYSHFLTPIIVSLDTPEPLLNRSALTSIFSNFIDIWNLHRSFLAALTSLLEPTQNMDGPPTKPNAPPDAVVVTVAPPALPKLSPLLLAHFPYLSLYTPFITAFPTTISALNDLITPPTSTRPNAQYNARFASFLAMQESDARCSKLKMRDWLLTIVQRCPRYLLLLKDLINATSPDDPEHAQLTAVHTLVSKITLSLNTSLQTHAQTLSLLALQKATPNLPFQLISPGRTFLKRGALLQAERNDDPVEREFLLFSDCLVWLANASGGAESGSGWDWSWSGSGSGSGGVGVGVTQSHQNTPVSKGGRVGMARTRSKSDAELETMRMGPQNQTSSELESESHSAFTRPVTPIRNSRPPLPPPNMPRRNNTNEDKWVYKGRVELVDAQIIVGSALEDERKFEVLSPEGSFVVYAPSASERDEWTTEIRQAKAQLLVSLNITHPNSTLTSSASTNHVRRALQALPYHPSDDRLASLRGSSSMGAVHDQGTLESSHSISFSTPLRGKARFGRKDKDRDKDTDKPKPKPGLSSERRRKVDHWVPAIWIPDGKTSSCMRCGRLFGWRRRRHHCRLCGRCVCAGCSGQTFYITDANSPKPETSTKPARACDACYESVFPLIRNLSSASEHEHQHEPTSDSEDVFRPSFSSSTTFFAEEGARATEGESESGIRENGVGVGSGSGLGPGADTIASLSRLPSWLSMPALPVHVQRQGKGKGKGKEPHALMDIDVNRDVSVSLGFEPPFGASGGGGNRIANGNEMDESRERRARLRVRPQQHQKMRSYHEILEDFERAQLQQQRAQAEAAQLVREAGEQDDKEEEEKEDDDDDDEEEEDKVDVEDENQYYVNYYNQVDEEAEDEDEEQDQIDTDIWFTPIHSVASSPLSLSSSSSPRKPRPKPQQAQRREDTARRSKRFSLPAIALHTTVVTARTSGSSSVSASADVGLSVGGGGVSTASMNTIEGAVTNTAPLSRSRESSSSLSLSLSNTHSHNSTNPREPQPHAQPIAPSRRFSLVSGSGSGGGVGVGVGVISGRRRNSYHPGFVQDGSSSSPTRARSRTKTHSGSGGINIDGEGDRAENNVSSGDLARGLAAARLSELLGRNVKVSSGVK